MASVPPRLACQSPGRRLRIQPRATEDLPDHRSKSLTDFVETGWVGSATGGGSAGAAGKSAGGGGVGTGATTIHTMTNNGLQAGGELEGAKHWKDEALN